MSLVTLLVILNLASLVVIASLVALVRSFGGLALSLLAEERRLGEPRPLSGLLSWLIRLPKDRPLPPPHVRRSGTPDTAGPLNSHVGSSRRVTPSTESSPE